MFVSPRDESMPNVAAGYDPKKTVSVRPSGSMATIITESLWAKTILVRRVKTINTIVFFMLIED